MNDLKIVEMPINDIIPYENNPRNNDSAVDKVAASIHEFGFKVPIIIDKNNVIVAGHTRLKAAEKLGLDSVPVIKADDLSEEQIKAFRLADNKTSEFAEWDFEALNEELEAISNIDMSEFGFEEMLEEAEEDPERENVDIEDGKYQLVIDCDSEEDMQEKYNAILEVGIECRISTL